VKPTLSLSTCWNSHRHQDGYAMLREIANLGFSHVELSHGIRITLVPGILRAVEEGVVKVGSTHNFCPLPTGVSRPAPNLYQPSALDERERDQWLRHTLRSLDFAAQVNAQVVVCHLGSVSFGWFNPARRLQKRLRAIEPSGGDAEDQPQLALVKPLAKLRKRMPAHWEHVKSGVRALLEAAAEKHLVLGLENREKFDELPVDADWLEFIEGFPAGAPIGYWHDTGHAELKERLGLLQHRMHLEKLARRTIGFHLHDVDALGQDHQPIGSGRVDFAMVSRFWRPEHQLVLELSPRALAEQVRESKRRVEALLAG
jgi:sugar phosphate isomerase/epimerase